MPALQAITKEEVKPAGAANSEESLFEYYRENAGSIYHLCGSCTMGDNAQTSVVDNRLRVHGIDHLRIVDASIGCAVHGFPTTTALWRYEDPVCPDCRSWVLACKNIERF